MWVRIPLGEKFDEIHEDAKKKFGEDGYELYKLMHNTREGRKMINQIRDLFEKPAREYDEFKSRMDLDDTWLKERLDESTPEQFELPGITESQEEKDDSEH